MTRLEPVASIIKKVDHKPLKEQRAYLMAAFAVEKGAERRRRIHAAMVKITTKVMKQELRGRA